MQMTGDLGATDQIKKQNGDALSSAIAQKNVRNWTETLEKQREIISRTHSAKKGNYIVRRREEFSYKEHKLPWETLN